MIEAGWVAFTVIIADWIIRIGLAVRIIMRRATVPVSLAWLLIVLFMPIVGLVAYLLIGETRLGRSRVRWHETWTKGIEEQAVALLRHRHYDWTPREEIYRHLARMGAAMGGLPPLRGNSLTLVSESDDFIDGLVRDIDEATEHCHLLYFIWMRGGRGVEVAEALIRAARRGVVCRVLVDAVGSRPFLRSDEARRMIEAGVRLVAALPVNPLRLLLARVDLRNHRKLAVFDGRVAYCGSQNVTDDTFKFNRKKRIGPWIDATVRLEGPAAQALQAVFLRDWLLDGGERFESLEPFFPEVALPDGGTDFPAAPGKTAPSVRKTRLENPSVGQPPAEQAGESVPPEGSSVVHVIPSGPGPAPEAIHQAFLATIYAATEELVITNPYFVPDEATKAALRVAAMRGVSVTIVLPEVLDAPVVAAASRSHYLDLLEAGVRILHYPGGLLHAKTITVDRRLAIIGSANLDTRSFWLNFELTLFIYDDDFASLLRFLQTSYIEPSQRIRREDWIRRPRWRVFVDNTAQLLSPLL